jgi:hypothetical protein
MAWVWPKNFLPQLDCFNSSEAASLLVFPGWSKFHRKKDYSPVFDISDAFAQNRNFLDEPEKTS